MVHVNLWGQGSEVGRGGLSSNIREAASTLHRVIPRLRILKLHTFAGLLSGGPVFTRQSVLEQAFDFLDASFSFNR